MPIDERKKLKTGMLSPMRDKNEGRGEGKTPVTGDHGFAEAELMVKTLSRVELESKRGDGKKRLLVCVV